MVVKAVIFDMDGVLVDSLTAIWKSFAVELAKHNIDYTKEDYRGRTGHSMPVFYKEWKERWGITIDHELFVNNAIVTQLEIIKEQKVATELIDFLEDLKKRKLKLAVASNSRKVRVEAFLEVLDIRKYMDEVVTIEDVVHHKPAPDIYLKAAEHLQLEPKDCIVIEDSHTGIQAGKSAGMKVFGLRHEWNDEKELAEAHYTVLSFIDVQKHL